MREREEWSGITASGRAVERHKRPATPTASGPPRTVLALAIPAMLIDMLVGKRLRVSVGAKDASDATGAVLALSGALSGAERIGNQEDCVH